MAEWHTLDSDDLPAAAREIVRLPRRRRRRFWIIATVLMIAIGGVIIRVWLAQSQTLRQADLNRVILAEETARFLGDRESAAALANPAAPPAWRRAYQQLFATPSPHPPGPIQLQEINFDGRCATVLATVTEHPQVRAYCLNGGRWQRSPIPRTTWGEEDFLFAAGSNLQLRFLERDRPFAEALAQELPIFLEAHVVKQGGERNKASKACNKVLPRARTL